MQENYFATDDHQRCYQQLISENGYSARRYYVDEFFFRQIHMFPKGAAIIDLGGKKQRKRGYFDIERYGFCVKYANLDAATQPDYVCDIAKVPIGDNSFDGVILSEVLEHLPSPDEVLHEAYRILKPEGSLLICTPFMYPVHADPHDFGRYTGTWYEKHLQEIGFQNIRVEKQGAFLSVMADALKIWSGALRRSYPTYRIRRFLVRTCVSWFMRHFFEWEQLPIYQTHPMLSGYTTGFGITCQKVSVKP